MTALRLKVEGLTKSYFGVPVLRGIDFEAYASEIIGIVGENGSGKSTAMNVLAGVALQDAGRVTLDGMAHQPHDRGAAEAAGIAFIQQELNIFPNLTIAENVFLGRFPRHFSGIPVVARRRMRALTRAVLQSLELDVDPEALADTLEPGERQLLEIARGVVGQARVVIFDEPTTSLTRPETDRLFDIIHRLKAQGATVLYISHALGDVLQIADRVMVMRDGSVARCFTQPDVTASDLVLAMVGRSIDALFPKRSASVCRSAPLLEVDRVGEPGVLSDNTLRVHPGEIVGLAGLMGSGRTELARVLFGLDPHRQGTIRFGGKLLQAGNIRERVDAGMAFLTEDRRSEGLLMEASVADNIALAALPFFANAAAQVDDSRLKHAVVEWITRLQVKTGPPESFAVRTLSGGNQQKVLFARWLLRRPQLFILDEPTRGVDVGAKEEIYRILAQLAEAGMGILVISSEIEELIGLADRILVLCRGHIVAEFAREEFDRERILKAAFGQGKAA